ncbi:MAG TPA: Hsp20 family protein [Allosphingosinicella sp.]|nr:Hsp20 family protein [Allosphingosinicella sp.]
MRTNFDLTPFRRSTVGFDRLFEMLENGTSLQNGEGYPPFDLERDAEDRFRITMAVAGFRQDEIDITAQQNLLVVSGRKQDSDEGRYIHRGIAARSFERRFALGDYVQVKNAELRDGLLSIELAREIPEEMKPRKIEIGGSENRQIDDKRSKGEKARNDNSKEREAA